LPKWIFGDSDVKWRIEQKGAGTVMLSGVLASTAPIGEYLLTVSMDIGNKVPPASGADDVSVNGNGDTSEEKWGPCRACV
jgi:hypothetical protein